MSETFTFLRFISRWLIALFLVMGTYNLSGYSYFHWLTDASSGQWLGKLFVGLVLAICYVTYILATVRSLGIYGIIIWAALFSCLAWLAVDIGIIERLSVETFATMVMVAMANVLGVGVSWSYIRGRLSGQQDTNDVTL
jgi:hypothetical protein